MSDLRIGPVGPERVPAFLELLEQAASWLWEREIRQWEPGSMRPQAPWVRRQIANGCLLGAVQDTVLAGGCVLTPVAGEIWADRPDPAIHLHKLVVARSVAGQGLGSRLLEGAERWAWERGADRLRLDCWEGNEVLKAWYQVRGYRSVGSALEHGYSVHRFELSLRREAQSWQLRPTRPADLDFVQRLETGPAYTPGIGHWSREEHLQAIGDPRRTHLVLSRSTDAEPRGFAIGYDLRESGHGIYLKRLAVEPIGEGLGRVALGLFVERALGDLAASHVWLIVRPGNARARRCYDRMGFVEVARAWPHRGHVLGLWPQGRSGTLPLR